MNKTGYSSFNVVSIFVFTVFCDHIKSSVIIFSFFDISKTIVSIWYLNSDDKLIRERVECVDSVVFRFKINIS